jgi:hypothetical protein
MNAGINDNIIFFFEEKEEYEKTEEKINNIQEENETSIIDNILNEVVDEDWNKEFTSFNDTLELMYFKDREFYGDDELYYNQEYNVKDLLKICQYYGIDKNIKSSKCKKQDIISTIIYFESLPENYAIVQKRNLMWAYMNELVNDQKMKKYLIW